MITSLTAIALWVLSVIGYVIFNLYTKNKKLEDLLNRYVNYSSEITILVKDFDELAKKIDSQIWIQSDPELLQLFENIKELQKKSKDFIQ